MTGRTSLSCRKPGCPANSARSSPSSQASLRLPMNSVLQGGLSFVLAMGTYATGRCAAGAACCVGTAAPGKLTEAGRGESGRNLPQKRHARQCGVPHSGK